MRTKITSSVIFLACLFMGYDSGLAQQVFTISTEPRPARFYRFNPKLYHRPAGGFLIAWTDSRDGVESIYAQHFDSEGRRVGDNFNIPAGELIAFGPEEKIMVVRHESSFMTYFEYYRALAYLYEPSGLIKGPIELARFEVPTDFFGCPAFGSFLSSIPSGYLFADVFLGAVNIVALDRELNITHNVTSSENLPVDARGFAITSTSDGAYVLYWFGSYDQSSEHTQLYGKFFNANHEVIADSVFLGDRWNTCDAVNPMRAVTLQDSLFQLFFTTNDTLWYLACDRRGNIVHAADSIAVGPPAGIPAFADLYTSVGISNIVDDAFFLTFNQIYFWQENDEFKHFRQTSLHEFGTDGRTQDEFVLSFPPYPITGTIHQLDQSHFQVPLSIDNDIFLGGFDRDLKLIDSTKINEDSLGANQRNPLSIPAPNEKFLVFWEDEIGKKARMLDADGNLLGSEFVPPVTHGRFFPSQQFLATWTSVKDRAYAVGYRIYSPDWKIIEDRELAARAGNVQLVQLSTEVMDDDSFLAFLQDSTELRLLSISKGNGILRDTLVTTGVEDYVSLRIASGGNGIFWVLWRFYRTNATHMRAYDLNFNRVSDLISNADVNVEGVQFLPDGRYAFLLWDSQHLTNSLVVKDVNQDEPIESIPIAEVASHSFQLEVLNERYFLIKWVEGREIFLRAFDRNGLPIKDAFAAYTLSSSAFTNTGLVTNGSKALVYWADIGIPGHGYDIMGKMLNASFIVNVKASQNQITRFNLEQNFPNPFNPITEIRFVLPSSGKARLTIYDILGRRVRTLVNGARPAGEQQVTWDGSDDAGASVASGIYFYRLEAGSLTAAHKLTLLR